ncbi:MAG: ABC transporter ATP-binding protein [Candidatus Hodarchaeales archaeon]|jgi:ABC-type lipoprotein export system ATPase subunit
MTFLEMQDIIKLYNPENEQLQVPALRGIDLVIDKPGLTAIIGPSGSGKSTLLKLLAGIEKPSSGKIFLEGKLINFLKGKTLRKYRQDVIGFVHQYPDQNFISGITVFDNITFPMKLKGQLSREERNKRAYELLTQLGVKSKKNYKYGQLSGGEAQRIAIGIALANNPKLILADEPTGELDSYNTFKIIELFKELEKDLGNAFIIVTHDNRFSNLTSQTYKLLDGRITSSHYLVSESSKLVIEKEKILIKRKHVTSVDRFGTLRVPEELLKEFKISKEVILKPNREKGVIEIIPFIRGS